MCMDPITAGFVLMGVSTGLQTVGTYQQQKAQNLALTYQAGLAEVNAAEAERRGRLEESRQRLKTRQLAGSQTAAYAGANVLVGEGSPVHAVLDTRQLGEMDAMTIRYNTAKEAWGYRTQAEMYRKQRQNPFLIAGTTLLGGSTNLMNMYLLGKSAKGSPTRIQ